MTVGNNKHACQQYSLKNLFLFYIPLRVPGSGFLPIETISGLSEGRKLHPRVSLFWNRIINFK